jgi:hypothetical protein
LGNPAAYANPNYRGQLIHDMNTPPPERRLLRLKAGSVCHSADFTPRTSRSSNDCVVRRSPSQLDLRQRRSRLATVPGDRPLPRSIQPDLQAAHSHQCRLKVLIPYRGLLKPDVPNVPESLTSLSFGQNSEPPIRGRFSLTILMQSRNFGAIFLARFQPKKSSSQGSFTNLSRGKNFRRIEGPSQPDSVDEQRPPHPSRHQFRTYRKLNFDEAGEGSGHNCQPA